MRKISESRSVLSDVMLPSQANPAGRVHGGEIMKMMDTCGGVAAMRHSKMNVVTVRVDELVFYEPINVGQLVICEAQLVFAGTTSMEVEVTVKVEDLVCGDCNRDEEKSCEDCTKVALTAYFTFVALDEKGKPSKVPGLLVETEEEKKAFEKGKERYLRHKASKKQP